MFSRFVSAAAVSAALALLSAAPSAAAPALTTDDFLAESAIQAPSLSPSGRYVALVRMDGKTRAAVVRDLQTQAETVLFSTPESQGVYFDWIRWKSDDRLLIGTTIYEETRAHGDETAKLKAYTYAHAVLAVGRDGEKRVPMFREVSGIATTRDIGRVLDLLENDPDHVLMVARYYTGVLAIWKVNVNTGKAELFEKGTADTEDWWTDRNGAVIARIDARARRGWVALQARAPGETEWTEVMRLRPKDYDQIGDFDVLGPAKEPGQLYVLKEPETELDGDTAAIHIYDFRTRKLGPALWRNAKYDTVTAIIDSDTFALKGGCYVAEVYQCEWGDAELDSAYAGLAEFFGDPRSITPVSHSKDDRLSVFAVSGPTEPLAYYLYDWKAKRADPLGAVSARLTSETLGRVERIRWKTRDGVELGGYLTVPAGAPAGPLPLVVMPHGGPEARDSYAYDRWAQFVAARGYMVFQPNFRGSGGFGRKFAEAGYGEWGGRMQNDVEDGVQALIQQGRADANRMCMFGASYGGYVALYAAAKEPDRYKCAISFAGVSDLKAMIQWEGDSFGTDSRRYEYWVQSLGDPKTARDRLVATSPITYAAQIKAPVLLVHGDYDWNVPIEQSEAMERALKRAKKPVRLIKLIEEAHGGWREANEKMALEAAGAFLDEHLGAAPAAKAAP